MLPLISFALVCDLSDVKRIVQQLIEMPTGKRQAIGLPTSALLRALLSISAAWVDAKSTTKGVIPCDS